MSFTRLLVAGPSARFGLGLHTQATGHFCFAAITRRSDFRTETDSVGPVAVKPADALYGSQTQRSIDLFQIGRNNSKNTKDFIPEEVIKALICIKRSAALVNKKNGKIQTEIADSIVAASDHILSSKEQIEKNFPLLIWQTGSGTHTNMNVNEVLANYANFKIHNQDLGKKYPVHPNDHVNMCQSSNDTFPSAMNITSAFAAEELTDTALYPLIKVLNEKSEKFSSIVKIARTHCQDAVPIKVGLELQAFSKTLFNSYKQIKNSIKGLTYIPLGGTAVGSGLNSYETFSKEVCKELNKYHLDNKNIYTYQPVGLKFKNDESPSWQMSSRNPIVSLHSSFALLASNVLKISNDIRMLASGPNCGLGDYILPINEPGSSIMPGKVNPTQCEMACMVSAQVLGNDQVMLISNSMGNFQLNTFMPLMAKNIIYSARLLTDSLKSLNQNCIKKIEINKEKLETYVASSPMLVTALNSTIGYDNCSKIVKFSSEQGISLKEAGKRLKLIEPEEYDRLVDPIKICGHLN